MNLQELAQQRGMTIEKLAEDAKVSDSTIKRLFKGESIRFDSQKKVAEALKLSIEELIAYSQVPSSDDEISTLVHDQLLKLSSLDLKFNPSREHLDWPVYRCIKDDIRGNLSYFHDELARLIKQAKDKQQLNALRELIFYCAAYYVQFDANIDLKTSSLVKLKDYANAWELRIFINSAIGKLEGLTFKLTSIKSNGAVKLEPVERAHQIGLNTSADAMELVFDIARQINAREPLTTKPCPNQLKKGNEDDLKQFKDFCADLNNTLGYYKNTQDNIFVFDNMPVSDDLAKALSEYLDNLRVMMIQGDDGKPFLVQQGMMHVQLKAQLKLIEAREKSLFGETITSEDKAMNRIENIDHVDMLIMTNTGTVNIGNQLNELIKTLTELHSMLTPNSLPDATYIEALEAAINAEDSQPKKAISLIEKALQKTEKVINAGSKAWTSYERALRLFNELASILG
ncbi:MAG: helix-turn-helix domain-containing protein [Gammaproteobacteria bacterium]|nr:helix-turn-helix domain-containing protein [Gammaproteobacteria bacterium]